MIRVLDSAGSTLVEWGRQQQQQDGRSPSLHKVSIIMVHNPHSQSSSERLHWSLKNIKGRSTTGLCPLHLLFTISLLAEFEDDTFVSVYAGDLMIVRSAHNKDMFMASIHPEKQWSLGVQRRY